MRKMMKTLDPSTRPRSFRRDSTGKQFGFLADAAMEQLEKHLKEVKSSHTTTGFAPVSEGKPVTEDCLIGCIRVLENEKDSVVTNLLSDIAGMSNFPSVREAARKVLKP